MLAKQAMQFNVSGLIQEGIGATRTYEVAGDVAIDGEEPKRVHGMTELLRTKDGVLVRAKVRFDEPEICSRCLKPVVETLEVAFEEEFLLTVDPHGSVADDDEVDPDAFRVDERHLLDLTEAVRQYREVSIEMQPLCRPDCRGLCPRCGADLNLGQCGCETGIVDVRWAGLAGFRAEVGEGKD